MVGGDRLAQMGADFLAGRWHALDFRIEVAIGTVRDVPHI